MAEHRLIAAVETARNSAKEHYDYAHTRLVGRDRRAIDEVRAAQDLATVERQVQSNLRRAGRGARGARDPAGGSGPSTRSTRSTSARFRRAQALDEARGRRTDVKVLELGPRPPSAITTRCGSSTRPS
jgi:hypothetical protein